MEKNQKFLLVQDIQIMVKWAKVQIYGRFYINVNNQGKILFESKIRMVFNSVPEKYLPIPLFPGQ